MPMQRLSSVRTWAGTHFKEDYSKIPTRTDYNVQSVQLPDRKKPSEAILVGSAFEEVRPYFRAVVDVLAWLNVGHIEVGYMTQNGDKRRAVVYQDLIDSGITFNEPFVWILRSADEIAVRRFEALLHHAFLLRGNPKRCIPLKATLDFKEHFPGACRDIAQVANQRLEEWKRITAPVQPDQDELPLNSLVSQHDHLGSKSLELIVNSMRVIFS